MECRHIHAVAGLEPGGDQPAVANGLADLDGPLFQAIAGRDDQHAGAAGGVPGHGLLGHEDGVFVTARGERGAHVHAGHQQALRIGEGGAQGDRRAGARSPPELRAFLRNLCVFESRGTRPDRRRPRGTRRLHLRRSSATRYSSVMSTARSSGIVSAAVAGGGHNVPPGDRRQSSIR